MDKVQRTDAEWRQQLTPQEYHVLREAGTEAPFTGEYTDTKTEGVYRCRACGAELFRSDAKFESHCGWPSFYQPTEDDAVILLEDRSGGMARTEVRCAACGSHLGHVFQGADLGAVAGEHGRARAGGSIGDGSFVVVWHPGHPSVGSSVSETELMHQRWSVGTS